MKLLSTTLEIPEQGFDNLIMDSPDNNQHLSLQAGNGLGDALNTSQFPIDMADMSSFDGPHVLPHALPTPDSSPSPNLVSILQLVFRAWRLLKLHSALPS